MTANGARGLGRDDLQSMGIWLASRAAVFTAALYASWVFTGPVGVFFGGPGELDPVDGPVTIWDQWDAEWYRSIAEDGYLASGHENNVAFPPGFPLLLRAASLAGLDALPAGLLVAAVAGLAASVALGRLTQAAGGRSALGTLAWVAAPMAVFLFAPYTETLFAAFAFWAWLLARQGLWWAAGVLGACASLVRVNGLFLAAGLAVMFLTERPRAWRSAPWLVLPFAAPLAYVVYLHGVTGSWTAWLEAQQTGWGREFSDPLDTLRTTYEMAFTNGVSASFAVQYRLEILALAAGIGFCVVVAYKKWWPELAYMALTLAALGTSTLYYSVPRALLTLFPIWMLIGTWMSRRTSVLVAYTSISSGLMFVGVAAFVTGRWVA